MNRRCKVSIVGAGAVGSTLAQRVIEGDLADVVLVDIVKGLAAGKGLDMADAAPVLGHERSIKGTDDYGDISLSDIVVITAGLARRPGMTREELLAKNADIVKSASLKIRSVTPDSIVIVVTNPLDAMTYLAHKTCGFGRGRVFGMAGVLDSSRFAGLVAEEMGTPRSSVETLVLGSHGDTMVALLSKTFVNGKNIRELLPKEKIDELVRRARDRGAEIVNLLGTGSAYYSPSASVYKMIEVILKDKKETMAVSAYLEGEYDLEDITIGVPCLLGADGIEEIIEFDLTDEEAASLARSADAIRAQIALL